MVIAQQAAENGMQELSRRAVAESLSGGFPVADPVATDPNASQTRTINLLSTGTTVGANQIEGEVVSSLEKVLQLWGRDGFFPNQEIYDVLKLLVFPASHPEDISMYVTAADLSATRISSLAESLVAAAVKAEKLQDLQAAIALRQQYPAAKVPAAAMNVLIDLQQNSLEPTSERLNLFSTESLKGLSTQDRQIVFLAALRAFDRPELKARAFPVLQHVLQTEMSARTSQERELDVAGKLAAIVNRYLAETGDTQAVVAYFDQLMASRQARYSRSSGDYVLYMQQGDLIKLSQQASTLGLDSIAQDYLGRATDFEVTQYGPVEFGQALAMVARQLRSLPADERYSRWLKWTLPAEGRQSLRAVYDAITPTFVAAAFTSKTHPYETQLRDGLISNFTELVDAAKQSNQLDNLKSLVEPLVAAKEKSADILLALILIAQEDIEAGLPQIRALQESFADRMKAEASASNSNRPRQPSSLADYLVFRACLQSKAFVHLYDDQLPSFRRQLQKYPSTALQRINLDWAARLNSSAIPDELSPSDPLTHWIPTYESENGARQQPWWAVYQDQIVALNGSSGSNLLYRYPLAGKNFTISIDCFAGDGSASNASFGGVLINALGSGSTTAIQSISGREQFSRRVSAGRSGSSFNRLTIEVEENAIRHLVNNRLVYQEPRTTTSPWLVLNSDGRRLSAFRNLQITGDVVTPKTISLLDGDQMEGWRCDAFNESQPRKRLMKEIPASENDSVAYYQRNEPVEYDWSTSNGVLKAMAVASAPSDWQSWIYYQRPLMDGELFEYEFYYSPGSTVTHPTIGQVALLCEPDGVVSHWISIRQNQDAHAVVPNNSLVDTAIRRGPAKLPLKPNDWNTVQLQLRDNVAVVTLNGTIVCERPLEPELGRRVGFFRYKQQACQIRNVTLRGNWPETLPTGEEMLEVDRTAAPESVLTVATIVDDTTIAHLADEVVATAQSMTTDAAYELLLDWVLPSSTHGHIRLHYSQVPTPPTSEGSSNQHFGFGQIVSPAVELVRLAAKLNKTEPLLKALDQFSRGSSTQQRAAHALQAIVALETNADQAIQKALKEVWSNVAQPYPTGTAVQMRAADFLVAWRAAQHPKYWSIGSDIARKLRDYERKSETASGDVNFKRQVHALVGTIERMARSNTSGPTRLESPQQLQWTPVPYLKPEHRWAGYRTSTWDVAKGSAQHFPADTWSQLFFQSPLQGKFEIVAQRTTYGNKELSIAWGMHSAEPTYDLKAVRVAKVMHSSKDISKDVKLPYWDQQAEFRIAVDGRKVTTWTNGVQIHEQIFDRAPDPWLLLQSRNAFDYSRVNNLRILGTPDIPTEIDLLNIAGLAGWAPMSTTSGLERKKTRQVIKQPILTVVKRYLGVVAVMNC